MDLYSKLPFPVTCIASNVPCLHEKFADLQYIAKTFFHFIISIESSYEILMDKTFRTHIIKWPLLQ
jgi:hypothetical protein